MLAFETKGWNAQQMYVSKVVQALLGDSAHSRNSKLRNNLVLAQNVVDSAKVVNFSFSDSGLFGV